MGSEHYFEKLVPVRIRNAPPVVSTLVFIHGIWVVFFFIHGIWVVFFFIHGIWVVFC
jgi:hypothetical protein